MIGHQQSIVSTWHYWKVEPTRLPRLLLPTPFLKIEVQLSKQEIVRQHQGCHTCRSPTKSIKHHIHLNKVISWSHGYHPLPNPIITFVLCWAISIQRSASYYCDRWRFEDMTLYISSENGVSCKPTKSKVSPTKNKGKSIVSILKRITWTKKVPCLL